MSLTPPTEQDIRDLGEQLHLDLSPEEVADFRRLVADGLDPYETVRDYAEPTTGTRLSDRETGGRVPPAADPYNAWITDCSVRTDSEGPLDGWDVAVKDNVAVAGVEMTCGSQVMEGYVPPRDATVVRRLLEAGAHVVGKTNMDDFAFTGNGHSSAFGPTLNPHDDDYLAGGSSGGSAIAVAEGEVKLGIGADQGGSIRVPAAWTGTVGHKPTHGLVPYTGIVGIENTIDHVGPMARDVETVARALTALAGRDPGDPRQPEEVPTQRYEEAIDGDVSSLSIGVIEEGFDRPECMESVNERTREGLAEFEDRGATVEEFSLPIHHDAVDIYTVALNEGTVAAFRGEGVGHNWWGQYDTAWVDSFGKFRRAHGGELPASVKYTLLIGAYTADRYHSRYYAKAMNLRRELRRRYDEALERYDLLATPTTPQTPHEYVPNQDRFAFLEDAWGSLGNTCQFNATGHPAVSVPLEPLDGLPVGLQLVGSHFDDATVLNAASTLG